MMMLYVSAYGLPVGHLYRHKPSGQLYVSDDDDDDDHRTTAYLVSRMIIS